MLQVGVDTPDTSLAPPVVVGLTDGPASVGHVLTVLPPPAGHLLVVCRVLPEGPQPERGAQGVVLNKLVLGHRGY